MGGIGPPCADLGFLCVLPQTGNIQYTQAGSFPQRVCLLGNRDGWLCEEHIISGETAVCCLSRWFSPANAQVISTLTSSAANETMQLEVTHAAVKCF